MGRTKKVLPPTEDGKIVVSSSADRTKRIQQLADASKGFSSFQPASQVLQHVKAIPSIFPQLDFATRVGGFPLQRFVTVHGKSNHGKTAFAIGCMRSFIENGHYAVFLDAERTTPIKWISQMMGESYGPLLKAHYPENYEDAADRVKKFLEKDLSEARKKGDIPPETSALIVVDSITKLSPSAVLGKILKEGSDGAGLDGMSGRGGQLHAAANKAWLNQLTPLLHDHNASLIAITRESEDPDALPYAKKAGTNYKVNGGASLIYDAGLVMRIIRDKWVTQGAYPDMKVFGERHKITITKTKIAGKDDKQVNAYFHTSNGQLIPEGFDIARDLIELGTKFEIVKKAGNWLQYEGKRWAGEHSAVKALTSNPELLLTLNEQVREHFTDESKLETVLHDDDGVIQE